MNKKENITRINNSRSLLKTVITSCEEGKDGRWDCSTDEGKEGFDAMIELLGTVDLILFKMKQDISKLPK